MNPPLKSPLFQLQPHEIARGFALVSPQTARVAQCEGRQFDYAFGRLDSGKPVYNGLWLRERGQEARGHWIVVSSEPPFAPYNMEIRSAKRWPDAEPTIANALDNRDGLTLARFVASPLRNSAPYALLMPGGTGCWFSYGRAASFDFAPNDAIAASSSAAATWLHRALSDKNSSVKFANEWISLNATGKVAALYGAAWLAQTHGAMRHILRALPAWNEINVLEEWAIHARAPHSRGWSAPDEASARQLESWAAWLAARFRARRLESWPDYRCIADIKEDEITQVTLRNPSSFHQKLESLLWLRDWLRDAATADECAQLLAQ